MKYRIPFNKPCFIGNENGYIRDALLNGHISGDGIFTRKCHGLLEAELGIKKVFLTTSCTHALEMSALLLHIEKGDEVIVPSFTFVSTVNAFVMRGAYPVFIDIRPDTLNLDESQLESKISNRTKAIVPVHYAGVGCEMDAINKVAQYHGLTVVEDNAHGLFGKYRGQYLGTFGDLATLSFHETKNFTCGEGGALLINDPKYVEQAEIIREKGTDRSRFFRGQVDKYSWVSIGSSYLPSDLLAAILYAQLEKREEIQKKRRSLWEYYFQKLKKWAENLSIRLPTVPSYCDQAYHMFYLLLPSAETRSRLIEYLKSVGILSVFHYLPLHLSSMGQRFGGRKGDCPITENISDRILRLPFYYELSQADQDFIISSLLKFRLA